MGVSFHKFTIHFVEVNLYPADAFQKMEREWLASTYYHQGRINHLGGAYQCKTGAPFLPFLPSPLFPSHPLHFPLLISSLPFS